MELVIDYRSESAFAHRHWIMIVGVIRFEFDWTKLAMQIKSVVTFDDGIDQNRIGNWVDVGNLVSCKY